MITITRRNGEGIIVGDDIVVTVIEVRGDRVRLGIECPKEVPLHRGEVFDAIRRAMTRPTGAEEKGATRPSNQGPDLR